MTRKLSMDRGEKKITMWKTRHGFCTMTLYNDFKKGCSAAW